MGLVKATSLLALLLSCARRPPADPVVLALGEQTVRRSEFERHVAMLESGEGPLAPAAKEALFASFVEERVLVLEAQARGLLEPGGSPDAEQGAVRRLLADAVHARVEVAEQEVADYFAAHPQEFELPESITLRQILVPTENEARDVRRRLSKDPRSFELLARARSRGPEASQGGLMGIFARGQLPSELELPAFALAPGRIGEVVASPLGFHVLRVDARDPGRARTLEETKEEIRARLRQRKSEQAARRFVQGLLARAKVNHEAANTDPRRS